MISKYLSEDDTFIIPFLWTREGEHDRIIKEIENIYNTGCRAFCVEARPYENFCKEPWFYDMDLILAEAKKRDMRVYVLDDCKYPTGYANGIIKNMYPHLRARFIREFHVDVAGPKKNGKLITLKKAEEELIAAVAYRRENNVFTGEGIVLTDKVIDSVLYWDIPEGNYTIVFVYLTTEGFERPFYIDMMNPKSVDCLIEACYEPHYERYSEEFGKTFAGFFSDEPRFANGMSYTYMSRKTEVGNPGISLPYSNDLMTLLSEELGRNDVAGMLGGLWFDTPDSPFIRRAYMNIISRKFEENFSKKISAWCRDRNVVHIGHVIEDMGTHCKTSNGAGHFFRSTSGFAMGGIDIVLHCLQPFMERFHTAYVLDAKSDSNFYKYTLAKLGASSAHIQPEKKGNTLCEIFGAYGYGENVALMKWLADHMLVRGINYFVPHAFSMRYPDNDCPPHFSGNNPVYRDMKVLFKYMSTVARVLKDSVHIAPVAVLYHAELSWSGKCMPVDFIATCLTRNQIDFDIIPFDSLLTCTVENNELYINKESYRCLIVPYSKVYPEDIKNTLNELANRGLDVIYLNEEGDNLLNEVNEYAEIKAEPPCSDLVYYKCVKNGTIIYMFFNEGKESCDVSVSVREQGPYIIADILKDKHEIKISDGRVPLSLSSYESCILIFDESLEYTEVNEIGFQYDITPAGEINIYLRKVTQSEFEPYMKTDRLFDITSYEHMPDFSGYIRYEITFDIRDEGKFILDLGDVENSCEIYINNIYAGTLICRPYRYDISEYIHSGRNIVEVICATTPVFEIKDNLSQFLTLGADGLTQTPVIRYYR